MIKMKIKQTIYHEVEMTEEQYKKFNELEYDFEKFDQLEWEGCIWDTDKDNYEFSLKGDKKC